MADNKKKEAKIFIEHWTGKGNEKQDTQKYWIELLSALGVSDPTRHAYFERPVRVKGKQKYIDVLIPSAKVLVEQKSLDVDLDKAELQSDGESLTPYEQGKRYADNLRLSDKPNWIVTCNFKELRVYDMDVDQPELNPTIVYLKDLEKDYAVLDFLVKEKKTQKKKEEQISIKAGEYVNRLYSAFRTLYGDDDDPMMFRYLNILCVRIVFLLYCEDSGILNKDQFPEFIKNASASQLRGELMQLFDTLNTKKESRSKFLDPSLAAFDYMNGGLFEELIDIPPCTDEIKQELISAAEDFDWSLINPTIFGAVFESTLNPETRRSGGMHYTSLENIHKVIDPLFLDDLKAELDEILKDPITKNKKARLEKYQDKLASLKFLESKTPYLIQFNDCPLMGVA